jgi:predicted ATP-dependent protease
MTLEQLQASLQACKEILARVEARHPDLPPTTRAAIEKLCRELQNELERRAA